MATVRIHETAGSAAQLLGNAASSRRPSVQPPEADHVDGSASAQTHCAFGRPAIPSKAGDAGTGQAVSSEPDTGNLWMPAGAHTRSAVGTGALLLMACVETAHGFRSLALYVLLGIVFVLSFRGRDGTDHERPGVSAMKRQPAAARLVPGSSLRMYVPIRLNPSAKVARAAHP